MKISLLPLRSLRHLRREYYPRFRGNWLFRVTAFAQPLQISTPIQPIRGAAPDPTWVAPTAHQILLNPDDGQYFTLDDVGARVWQLCDGTHAVTDVVSAIHAEYDAPLATIQCDVVELLDDLTREKLLAAA